MTTATQTAPERFDAADDEAAGALLAGELRALTAAEVMHKCGMGRTRLYELLSSDEFPQPIRNGRSVRWLSDEVDAWLRSRPRGRPDAAAA